MGENPTAIEKFCKITIARNQPQSQDEGFRIIHRICCLKSFGSKGVPGDFGDHITNNIYVATTEKLYQSIFVEGEFLFQIQDRMYGPYGLCADTLYISQVKTNLHV